MHTISNKFIAHSSNLPHSNDKIREKSIRFSTFLVLEIRGFLLFNDTTQESSQTGMFCFCLKNKELFIFEMRSS